jgi:hypothetical protein
MAGDGQQPKRRIQPELVSPSEAAANPLFVQATSVTTETSKEGQTPSNLREQAAYAAANLGPGRRIWVDIIERKDDIDYHKVKIFHVWLHIKNMSAGFSNSQK